MHRATPHASSFRGYSSGGARCLISEIDDSSLMQSMSGSSMKGEAHEGIEAPQNYGFTSVVADATKGKDGQIEQGAEGFMSFIGGSRSFPVCGIMDDRRHRLLNLAKDAAKGAVAMFGLKDWGQQFLITDDGIHMTGNKEKKIRFQLVENNNKQQQQGGSGKSAGTHAAGGNGSSGAQSGGQQQNKPTGQKSLHKQEAKTFHEISEEAQHLARGDGHHKISDKKIINYYKDETKSNQVDDRHSHIRYGDNRIFSDTSGCWSTVAIAVKPDPDQSAATLAAWEERQAAFRADAGTVEMTRRLASATPAEIDVWLARNVNDMAQARAVLGQIMKAIAVLR